MNIVLTGFMASGKTVLGKCLAGMLNMDFVDSDAKIQETSGMTIPEIFERLGEEHFRELEKKTIKEIAEKDFCIIATGGGVVLDSENIFELRKNGIIVNLETTPEIIIERLGGGDNERPLLNGKSIEETIERFNQRKPYYDNCDIKIILDKDKGIEETSKEIIEILEEKYESKIWSGRE